MPAPRCKAMLARVSGLCRRPFILGFGILHRLQTGGTLPQPSTHGRLRSSRTAGGATNLNSSAHSTRQARACVSSVDENFRRSPARSSLLARNDTGTFIAAMLRTLSLKPERFVIRILPAFPSEDGPRQVAREQFHLSRRALPSIPAGLPPGFVRRDNIPARPGPLDRDQNKGHCCPSTRKDRPLEILTWRERTHVHGPNA
jgi:hypothetical protein